MTAATLALAACGSAGANAPDLTPTASSVSAGVAGVNGATASAACAAKTKKLTFYGVAALNDAAKAGKAYMENAHPGLTVDLRTSAPSYSDVVQQIHADLTAHQQVDVAVASFNLLPEFAQQFNAKPFSGAVLRSTYDLRFLPLGQVSGKQIGIPEQVSMPVLVYNADVLAKAGVDPSTLKTTDGVLAAATKIKIAYPGIQPIDLPTGDEFGQWYLNSLATSKGSSIQNADGTPNVDSSAAQQAARFLAAVGRFGAQSDDPTTTSLLRFGVQRQTAMVAASLAAVGPGLKFVESQGAKGFKIGVVPFPTLPGGTLRPVSGGNALTVLSTDSCHQEMARELIASLLAPAVVAASVEAVSYLPVDSAALASLSGYYQRYPQLAQFNALAGSLAKVPQWPGTRGGEVPQELTDQVIRIMRGADPAGTLANAQTTTRQLTKS